MNKYDVIIIARVTRGQMKNRFCEFISLWIYFEGLVKRSSAELHTEYQGAYLCRTHVMATYLIVIAVGTERVHVDGVV